MEEITKKADGLPHVAEAALIKLYLPRVSFFL